MHRFDIISRNGVNYVIACTLKSGHEYKEDWRSPGKIQVCVLPEDLSSVDEVLRSYVAANEGVFECIPPESEEGTWEIKQILDEASSDMAFADFDNDGELEMLTISPFHGEKISIFKKQDGKFKKVYTYEKDAEFAHGIWGGEIAGTQGVLIGHRKGERNLLFFRCTDPEKLTFTADLLDSDVGPANVLHYTNDGEDYILSANREIDEIALYKVEK